MGLFLSDKELQKFYDNGVTDEDIQRTVNLYRQEGVSDDEIRRKIDTKLSSFDDNMSIEQNKGVDITPSGITKQPAKLFTQGINKYIAAPVVSKMENLPYDKALQEVERRRSDLEKPNPFQGIQDFIVDTVGYSALPIAKGAGGLNFAKNALIQGGIPGAIEGLKEGEPLSGAGTGTAIAGGINAIPVVGKIASNVGKWSAFQAAKNFGGLKPETLKQLVKPNSKALDLDNDAVQNLLMNTTERVQNDYKNLLDKAGQAVNEAALRLPEDISVSASSLKNSLDDIYSSRSVSGQRDLNPAFDVAGDIYDNLTNKIDLASDVPNIGNVNAPKLADIMNSIKNYPIDWAKSSAQDRQNILKQIYGNYAKRLGNLSPELRKANREFSKLAKFDDNEGLRQIINPNVIAGNKIDSASRVLRNYNSTVTKGNTNRNIQDLENLLVENGKQPFLNDIDDVNAATDFLESIKTGRNLGGATDWVRAFGIKPALKAIREYNRTGIPQAVSNFNQNVSPAIRRLLTIGAVKGSVPMLYGEISND